MKQDIENIIKKNLPENKKKSFIKSSGIGMNNDAYKHYSEIVDGFNQALSQIPVSLIADEVLKVVVEKIEKHKQDIVFLSKQIAFQDKKLQTIYKSQINCVEDILELLNNHN